MNKNSKPSKDILTFDEFKQGDLYHRAYTTGFRSSTPNIIVSFHLLSMIASCDKTFSEEYYALMREAVDNTDIFTDLGTVKVKHVDYAFIDAAGLCVVVLKNGKEACVLADDLSKTATNPISVDSVDKIKLSTKRLKDFVIENIDSFPYLQKMTKRIEASSIGRSEIDKRMDYLAEFCCQDSAIVNHLFDFLSELRYLFDNSSFVFKR